MKNYYAFILLVWIIALLLVIASVGNPIEKHNKKHDNITLSNFSRISSKIESYYSNNGKLPENLKLIDDEQYPLEFKNKKTKKEFEYKITSDLNYQLCTDFFTDSSNTALYVTENSHKKGYDCITYKVLGNNIVEDWQSISPTPIVSQPPVNSFYVERDFGSPDTRIYFHMAIPQNLKIVYGKEGATGGKTAFELNGKSLLEFTIPHTAVQEKVEDYEKIENPNIPDGLYRVSGDSRKSATGILAESYVDNLYFESGDDKCPVALVDNPPCSDMTINTWAVTAVFVGDIWNRQIADEIMGSLSPVPKF